MVVAGGKAAPLPTHRPQRQKATNMGTASEFFHKIVDLLPHKQESDRDEMHATVEEEIAPLYGRNAVAPGVQKPASTEVQKTPEKREETPEKK